MLGIEGLWDFIVLFSLLYSGNGHSNKYQRNLFCVKRRICVMSSSVCLHSLLPSHPPPPLPPPPPSPPTAKIYSGESQHCTSSPPHPTTPHHLPDPNSPDTSPPYPVSLHTVSPHLVARGKGRALFPGKGHIY